ncbi:MAG: hypothetical protein LQ346_007221 [Caloplaca aetnensis]|nr:MAG: hypothetical protein LQ346_007221 [Caloplaca aetnensis]
MTAITSDADLPRCLNSSRKQIHRARQLAALHTGTRVRNARCAQPQGFFSRTVIVTLQNGEEVVIQFRPEPLDPEPFALARRSLGDAVPEVHVVEDEDLARCQISVYCMTCVPGQTWLRGARGKTSETLGITLRSLARLLAKGAIIPADSSKQVVESQLRPHLALILSSDDAHVRPFHHVAQDLLGKLDRLSLQPLFVSHFDLNDVNIMVDTDCQVTGIVDWELSTPLPFGMGLCRIHTLAGEYAEQKFYMPPHFEEVEREFWQEIDHHIPDHVRSRFHADPEATQIAVTLGTLLDAFQLDEGKIGPCNPVVIESLPTLLTYRIPLIRGSSSPYSRIEPVQLV